LRLGDRCGRRQHRRRERALRRQHRAPLAPATTPAPPRLGGTRRRRIRRTLRADLRRLRHLLAGEHRDLAGAFDAFLGELGRGLVDHFFVIAIVLVVQIVVLVVVEIVIVLVVVEVIIVVVILVIIDELAVLALGILLVLIVVEQIVVFEI